MDIFGDINRAITGPIKDLTGYNLNDAGKDINAGWEATTRTISEAPLNIGNGVNSAINSVASSVGSITNLGLGSLKKYAPYVALGAIAVVGAKVATSSSGKKILKKLI